MYCTAGDISRRQALGKGKSREQRNESALPREERGRSIARVELLMRDTSCNFFLILIRLKMMIKFHSYVDLDDGNRF